MRCVFYCLTISIVSGSRFLLTINPPPSPQITEISTRTLEFSRHHANRAYQTQRSGPVLGSLPSLQEVEDMINMQRQNQEALMRIRTAVLNQEHALAEQMAQRKAFKSNGVHEDEAMAMYQEEYKGSGGFAGAEAKKRRGVC